MAKKKCRKNREPSREEISDLFLNAELSLPACSAGEASTLSRGWSSGESCRRMSSSTAPRSVHFYFRKCRNFAFQLLIGYAGRWKMFCEQTELNFFAFKRATAQVLAGAFQSLGIMFNFPICTFFCKESYRIK
jgi:hypothetical protein